MSAQTDTPPGWALITVGEACDLLNGRAFKPTEWSQEGKPIIRIQNLNNPRAPFNHFAGDVKPEHEVEPGDLLFAWSGTPGTSFGAHIWHGPRAVLNQHIFKVIIRGGCFDKRFLRHALNQRLQELVAQAQGGVGLAHITKGKLEDTELPLPPVAEQRRIVAKLDELLAGSRSAMAALASVPPLVEQYRTAVLSAAIRGRLSAAWRQRACEDIQRGSHFNDRSDGALPTGWSVVAVEDAGRVQLGRQRSPEYHQGPQMRPYLRVMNVFEDAIELSDVMQMHFSDEDFARFELQPGDILLNEGQSKELVGRSAMYRGEVPGACFTNSLVRFRASSRVDAEYALLVFLAYLKIRRFESIATVTTNIAHLGAGRFARLEFPLPPKPEQEVIVAVARQMLSAADRLRTRAEAMQRSVQSLNMSVLAKAFRGDLIPQDSADEPASALLGRLRAERAAAPTGRSPRRTAARV